MGRPMESGRNGERTTRPDSRARAAIAPRRARPVLGHPTYRAPRYHTRLWGRLIFALFVVALAGGLGITGGLYWSLHRSQSASSQHVAVHVGAGDTVTSIADNLQIRGIISNTLLFRLDARLQDLGGKLKMGDYTLRRNMSIDQMVTALTIYHSPYINIVIPEGWRMEQIAQVLQRHGINGQEFLRAARSPTRYPALRFSILADKPVWASLEGYLFPNTYRVPPHYDAVLFVADMVKTLDQRFTPAMRQAATRRGWTIYRILTLASIVEREARAPNERPLIASVYENRLRQGGWQLNADPTVQYAVGKPGQWWPVLRLDPHTVTSPYNTYVHYGLPPGPIANPGLASIQATIYPARSNYFYFVAKGNGTHAFASSYAQQLQNQTRYQHP